MSTDRLDAYRALLSHGPPDDGHHWGATLTQAGDHDRMQTVWSRLTRAHIAHRMLEQDTGREGESR
jgi:hypothetical protein